MMYLIFNSIFYYYYYSIIYRIILKNNNYLLKNIFNKIELLNYQELSSRIVSSLHSTTIFIYCLLNFNPTIWYKIRYITIGYCLYDLEKIYKIPQINKSSGISTYIHHILLLLSVTLFNTNINMLYLHQILLVEITTPFLNYSWYLYKSNSQKKIKFYICILILLSLFLYYRIIKLTIIFKLYYNNIGLNIPLLLFILLNYYWFYKLIKISFKTIF